MDFEQQLKFLLHGLSLVSLLQSFLPEVMRPPTCRISTDAGNLRAGNILCANFFVETMRDSNMVMKQNCLTSRFERLGNDVSEVRLMTCMGD